MYEEPIKARLHSVEKGRGGHYVVAFPFPGPLEKSRKTSPRTMLCENKIIGRTKKETRLDMCKSP